jgi:hypothetical protein
VIAVVTSELLFRVAVVFNIPIVKSISRTSVHIYLITGIYERFGKYVKTMGSGLQYFNPFTDKIHVLDMKTNIINLTRQKALTKDNI